MTAKETLGGQHTFHVELFCSEDKKIHHKTIVFHEDRPLTTIHEVKSAIERDFNIPVCVQILSYDDHPISDETTLKKTHIRDGDTFRVTYSSEGDCKEIREVVTWFKLVKQFLLEENPTISNNRLSSNFDHLLTTGINEELVENLAFIYLYPWLDARKYVNKLFFVSCGGLKTMMDIYTALLKHSWNDCIGNLQCLEYNILRVLWNLSETFELRRLILSHNDCLKLCLCSLLREKMVDGVDVRNVHGSLNNFEDDHMMLIDTIGAAVGFLCNICELPECHLEIASHQDCLEQLSCISIAPYIHPITVQFVATLFLCLANTPETHPFLARPLLIRRLLDATVKGHSAGSLMLRYFTQVYLSQLILVSPDCITEEFQLQIYQSMTDFLKIATYQEVMKGEVEHLYVWSTFVPYVKLIYLKQPPMSFCGTASQSSIMDQLHMLSLRTILLALQNMLSRPNHMEVLFREQLEDYVVCMPSYVPVSLKPEAIELVKIVRLGSGQLQPPKLVNLVKCKLAKLHFGLESLLNRTVGEIISTVLCNS